MQRFQHIRRKLFTILFVFSIFHSLMHPVFSQSYFPDWSAEATLPKRDDRRNILQLPESEWKIVVDRGKLHAAWYPYKQTGMLIPVKEFEEQLSIPRFGRPFNSTNDLFEWMNLPKYPNNKNSLTDFPLPKGIAPGSHVGVTHIRRDDWDGMTFGCTACHADQLFGKPIFGLANRYGRGSDFFYFGKAVDKIAAIAGIETAPKGSLLEQESRPMKWVGAKMPGGPGLITSLAQTSLSLSLRRDDPLAAMTGEPNMSAHDASVFQKLDAASKPPALWLTKYKTRWLNDGSQVSGNPVHVNFTWNEIGRGGDMKKLQRWFVEEARIVDELTAAVFATQSPRITEFFDASKIDLTKAIRGENLFNQHCARCHGRYEKRWNVADDGSKIDRAELLKTTKVIYPRKTRVIDVDTDPNRYIGMRTLAPQLNRLKISSELGIRYEPQTGYVPPPLEGIWARWPYFHNNSVPTLRDVLTRSADRPKVYFAGKPMDRETDFDFVRNGYPTGDGIPISWRDDFRNRFDTSLPGLSNVGHDEGIFLKSGREILSGDDKDAMVEFLKTL